MNRKKTILFLEDEEELLSTVTTLLTDQGYEVTCTRTAEEGLKIIHQSMPDLILADIKLPGADGFEFFKDFKQMKESKNVPFVFLTAFNNLRAAMDAKKQGAAEYITKPFEFEYLVSRILELAPP